jgi:hypothetical protein
MLEICGLKNRKFQCQLQNPQEKATVFTATAGETFSYVNSSLF